MSGANKEALIADLKAKIESCQQSIRYIEADDRAATNGGYNRIRDIEREIGNLRTRIIDAGGVP